jgi:predicted CopG family antitoxin
MKTIMIQDTVYRKLAVLKKKRSFSEVLEELVEESKAVKQARLRRYFGIVKDEDAKTMKAKAAKIRSELEVRPL